MSCYKSYTADVWSSETQNHLNSESGNVFELRITKLEVEQIHKWGEKKKKDSLNDN